MRVCMGLYASVFVHVQSSCSPSHPSLAICALLFGRLPNSELHKLLKAMDPDTPISKESVAELLNKFDKDQNGTMDFDEFVAFFMVWLFPQSNLGIKLSELWIFQ